MRIPFLLLATLPAIACGPSDPAPAPLPTYGTCDLRTSRHSCIEATGTALDIVHQKAGCLDASGTWLEGACPDTDLIGCCTYTFGMAFRECFYIGTTNSDPGAACTEAFDDAVWTPAD